MNVLAADSGFFANLLEEVALEVGAGGDGELVSLYPTADGVDFPIRQRGSRSQRVSRKESAEETYQQCPIILHRECDEKYVAGVYVLIDEAMLQGAGMMRTANAARRALAIGGLLLLCLIWAWDSLRGEMLPESSWAASFPTLQVEAMLLGLLAGVAGTAALIRKQLRPDRRELGAAVLTGLGLFTAPSLMTEWTKDWIGASTRVALTSLAPIFAVVFEPYLGDENEPGQRHGFAAAMVAVAGTLMVFPIDLPYSVGGGFALVGVVVSAACVAAANCLGVRIARAGSAFRFAAMTAGSSAVVLAVLGALRPNAVRAVDSWSALDVVALAVLFWLMGRMSAARMTTRFVIAPLLANLIGIALVRPGVDLRGWAGLGLIAIGSGWMLLRREEMTEASIRTGLSAE